MAITGQQIAFALRRAGVCNSRQAEMIERDLGDGSDAATAELRVRVTALETEMARRKPGPKPKVAEES